MTDHEIAKQRYMAYRAAASVRAINLTGSVVTVSDHATVYQASDGAFVEAVIWVPIEALPEGLR